jgi:hypothetical protein
LLLRRVLCIRGNSRDEVAVKTSSAGQVSQNRMESRALGGVSKLALCAGLSLLFVAGAAPAQAQFGWFGGLAGSCWRGEARSDGRSDEQCYRAQFGKFLRGTIKFYSAGKLTGEGDSVFAFDPQAKVVIYSQWSSNGGVGFGEATLEGDELIFQNRGPEGSDAPARSVWRRVDADSFRVSRERRSESGWNEESRVTYTRVRAAPGKS